jgi:hypothetical protein
LNAVEDPSNYVTFRFLTQFSRQQTKPGRIQRMAGGRTRVIRQAGMSRSWDLGFKYVTPEQKEWLEDHSGVVMCVRDDRGHKMFGTYLGVDVSEWMYNHQGEASLMFQEVSFSEHVA